MNSRRKPEKKSIFERGGFYTALYASIAVVMVVAIGITYSSLSNNEKRAAMNDPLLSRGDGMVTAEKPVVSARPNQAQANVNSQGITVERGDVEDILPASGQKDRAVTSLNTQAKAAGAESVLPQVPKVQSEAAQLEIAQSEIAQANEESVPVSMNTQAGLELVGQGESSTSVSQNSPEVQGGIIPDNTSAGSTVSAEMLADPVFNTFTGNEDMDWPVSGEVVMDFSVERLVYDVTLDQYRTNDNICIAAAVGEQVKASADGIVRSIDNTREMGNSIVIEHGNGWFTTYSQLQNGILVNEGDVVNAGQVIGGVGEPSIYSTLLGSHLSFKVVKDDAAVNPSLVLAINE